MKKRITGVIFLGVGFLFLTFFAMKQAPGKNPKGIEIVDDYAVQTMEPLDRKSIDRACMRFRTIYDRYLADKNIPVYYAIIPDKGYFVKESAMDYRELITQMNQGMDFATYLDIMPFLTLQDYYGTDVHWRQERIPDVAAYLVEQMGGTIGKDYATVLATDSFYGSYAKDVTVKMKADELYYLENRNIKHYEVYDYETNKQIPVYQIELAETDRPYDLFLSGAKSLLTIENPNADNDRELIVFRDSFGSSIAPLLADGYKKVTLVDIRYLSSASLDKFIGFDRQDVLFLYSTPVLNNSITLK